MLKIYPELLLFFSISLGLLAGCGDASSRLHDTRPTEPWLLDFSARPSYLPSNFIALTFDDVPDWNHTTRVLDVLRDKGVPSTFFINTYNWSDVAQERPMQDLIRRMAQEGHEIGNHTARHQQLASLSPEEIETEISTVEELTARLLGPGSPPLTILRAPYGNPYREHDPAAPSADYDKVAPIIAQHGIHIGWSIDAVDYICPDAACVYGNVMERVDEGSYGIVLLHAVYAATAEALPRLIDTLRERGYEFGTVEDAVKARFGASSRELMGL